MKRLLILTLILPCFWSACLAQSIGIKTNILYDATLNANLGMEWQIAPRWSVDLSGNINAWTFSNGKRWKNWIVQPEARYWFCEATQGHFVAAHLIGGQYNIGGLPFKSGPLKIFHDSRYQGWGIGAGIGYGYSWILSRHWSIETEIAVGYIYLNYDRYPCAECGSKDRSGKSGNYVGPSKTAVNLIYVF